MAGEVGVIQIVIFYFVTHDNGNAVMVFFNGWRGFFSKNYKLVNAVLIAVKST